MIIRDSDRLVPERFRNISTLTNAMKEKGFRPLRTVDTEARDALDRYIRHMPVIHNALYQIRKQGRLNLLYMKAILPVNRGGVVRVEMDFVSGLFLHDSDNWIYSAPIYHWGKEISVSESISGLNQLIMY